MGFTSHRPSSNTRLRLDAQTNAGGLSKGQASQGGGIPGRCGECRSVRDL